jgi:uncharacterized membrane protein
MQHFEESILVNIPLEECLRLWITYDHYPDFVFSEPPTVPDKWSSADALGENAIGGSRQLDWSIVGHPGKDHKQICWHLQNKLQQRLINVSGFVTFDALGADITQIKMSMTWNSLTNEGETHCLTQMRPEEILSKQLVAFKNLAHQFTPHPKVELKIAV